jgi:hypothetical protein
MGSAYSMIILLSQEVCFFVDTNTAVQMTTIFALPYKVLQCMPTAGPPNNKFYETAPEASIYKQSSSIVYGLIQKYSLHFASI